jgi:hypothetical protein
MISPTNIGQIDSNADNFIEVEARQPAGVRSVHDGAGVLCVEMARPVSSRSAAKNPPPDARWANFTRFFTLFPAMGSTALDATFLTQNR